MAANGPSIGADVAGATTSASGTYFVPGLYELEVVDVKVFSGQTDGVTTVAVEFLIHKFTPKGNAKVEDRPVGTTVSWVQKLRPDIKKTVLGNLKTCALAILKQLAKNNNQEGWEAITEDAVTQQMVDENIFCNNSKIIGMKIGSEAYEHETKGKKNIIVLNKWRVL